MGLLDSIYFGHKADFGGETGGLLDLLRRSQTQQEQYQPSAGFGQPPVQPEQASPLNIGGYQMPRMGTAAQFTPDPAAIPQNAQPTQGMMPQGAPQQPQGLPPALSSIGSALGRIGSPDGLIARLTGNDTRSQAKENLKAQYEALVPLVGPQKAMLAVMNPEAGKTILAQALDKKQYGFQKADDGTVLRTDPMTGKVEVAYGGNEANRTGVAGPDGKIIPYPEGLDAAGRKTFANEIARINADAAGGKKTEVQAKSEKFANKMENAEKNISGLDQKFTGPQGAYMKSTEALPFGGSIQSTEYQKYKQARDNFITALLRDESGAAIGTQEFARYERELFPQVGETDPTVIEQKRQARKVAVEAMKKSAGPGYKSPEQPETAPTSSIQEGATATNPQTGAKLTFRNGKWQ